MAPTPKRKHSTRRKGIRRAVRKAEHVTKLKNLNPVKNKHLRSLSASKEN